MNFGTTIFVCLCAIEAVYGLRCYNTLTAEVEVEVAAIEPYIGQACTACFTFNGIDNGTPYVATSCLPITTEDRCVEATLNGISGTFCYCSTDLCNIESNAGSAVNVSKKTLLLLLFSFISLLKLF